MTIYLNIPDKTHEDTKNPKSVKNAHFVWITSFVCVVFVFALVFVFAFDNENNEKFRKKECEYPVPIYPTSRSDEADSDVSEHPYEDSSESSYKLGEGTEPPFFERKVKIAEKPDPKELILQAILNNDGYKAKALSKSFYGNLNGVKEFRPLSLAAERCKPKVFEILLKNGADINIVGGMGWRPIHVATWNGCKEIVEMLIENNADLNAKITLGYTALQIAVQDGQKEIIPLLTAAKDLSDNENVTWRDGEEASSFEITTEDLSGMERGIEDDDWNPTPSEEDSLFSLVSEASFFENLSERSTRSNDR